MTNISSDFIATKITPTEDILWLTYKVIMTRYYEDEKVESSKPSKLKRC